MTIGIDARFYSTSFTGIGRYAAELIARLPALMPEADFVIFLNEPEYSAFTHPSPRVTKRLAGAKHYSLGEQTHFLRALMAEKLDLMHFMHFNAPILYPRRSIVTIHDLILHLHPGKKMTNPLHRLGYHATIHAAARKASRIIAVSETTKRDVSHYLHISKERIDAIYNGVSPEFTPVADAAPLRKHLSERYGIDSPYALYAGVWRDHKNLVRLVEALSHTDIPLLVITGRDDALYGPPLRDKIRELGLLTRVIFTGLVPANDMMTLMQAAHLFTFPSLYEGFGLPPLEAMACSIPVAASHASCIPEVIGEGNAAFFDPLDVSDMGRALHTAWHDEALRRDLTKRGIARAAAFTWDRSAEETAQSYKKALAAH